MEDQWWQNDPLADVSAVKAESADETDAVATAKEGERKAALLATRLAGSISEIGGATKRDPSASKPPVLPAISRSVLGEGEIAGWITNSLTDSDRQIIEGAQKNAMDAALTLGTGAAYTDEQKKNYYSFMFPQLGDAEPTVAAKQKRMAVLLEAARIGAGAAAPQIDEALKRAGIDIGSPGDPEEQIDVIRGMDFLDEKDREALIQNVIKKNWNTPPLEVTVTDDSPDPNTPQPTTPTEDPSLLQRLGKSTVNVVAGLGQAAAAIPDAAANALAGTLAIPADAMGFDGVAASLRNPFQIGDAIEKVAPTPQDWTGWGVRKLSEFVGGAAMLPARATNALADMVVGKVLSAPRNALAAVPNSQFVREADELGIEPMMATVGGPATRTLTAAAAQTFGGARPIVARGQKMLEQGSQAVKNIAGREGEILTMEDIGEAATKGALKYRSASRTAISQQYDKAAQLSQGIRVKPDATVAALDSELADLGNIPMAEEGAAYLQLLRKNLVEKFPEGVTVQGLRGLRTQLRDKFYKDGLRGSDIERRVNGIVDNISDDINGALTEAGKSEAAVLFRQADEGWKVRSELLDDFIMPFIGKKGEKTGEEVARSLENATRSKGAKFERFISALPAEEAGSVRASLINGMGKAKPGVQNAEGDAFSFNTLLTNWVQVGPRARRALFSEGDREAMDKLARVAERVKDSAGYANSSNTGGAVVNLAHLLMVPANPVGAGLGFAGSSALGSVLASPAGARLLAKVVEAKTPITAKDAIKQLSVLATRNPVIAEDVAGLQKYLTSAMNDNAGRVTSAAAEDKEQ